MTDAGSRRGFITGGSWCVDRNKLIEFWPEEDSICEILSAGRRAVIVPRVEPRLEQLLRARALERLDLVSLLHPDELTPPVLADRVRTQLAAPDAPRCMHLRAAESLVEELDEALSEQPTRYALAGEP